MHITIDEMITVLRAMPRGEEREALLQKILAANDCGACGSCNCVVAHKSRCKFAKDAAFDNHVQYRHTKAGAALAKAEAAAARPLNIEHGKMTCPTCKKKTKPALLEKGYTVTHDLVAIVGNEVRAHGWDGSSRSVTEEGDQGYFLECQNCLAEIPLADGMTVEWQ